MEDPRMISSVSDGAFDEASAPRTRIAARGYWLRSLGQLRREKGGLVAIGLIALILAVGFLADWLAPYGYQHFDIHGVNRAPTFQHWHLFGTDGVGHDIFSRTLFAIRTSVLIGLVVGAAAGTLGLAVGTLAGYYGGLLAGIAMWCVQLVTAVPALLLLFTGVVLVGQA